MLCRWSSNSLIYFILFSHVQRSACVCVICTTHVPGWQQPKEGVRSSRPRVTDEATQCAVLGTEPRFHTGAASALNSQIYTHLLKSPVRLTMGGCYNVHRSPETAKTGTAIALLVGNRILSSRREQCEVETPLCSAGHLTARNAKPTALQYYRTNFLKKGWSQWHSVMPELRG